MKVIVYPTDNYGCGHYRMIWPAEALAAQGHDVTIVRPKESTGIGGLLLDGEVSGLITPECDVMVFQRPARKRIGDMIPHLRKKGIAVVVDMDDDLERIHPSNPAFKGMHPKHSPDYNWENARRACRAATMVTVSTPALSRRYGPARILRNMVPQSMLTTSHDPAEDVVGWAGSLHSHPDDLKVASGALSRLAGEGRRLKFVGPDEGVTELLGLSPGAAEFTGNLDLTEWGPAVAELGVGVAPLAQTTFNESKSWLKPLEYSASGVPWVGSPTEEYRRLAKVCGMPLATKPKEWYAALRWMLEDEPRRVAASGRVREAAAGLTIEGNAHMWAEAWEDALKSERAARGTTKIGV